MNTLSVALTAILLLGLVAFMAPNILALNRGKVLRNIALWLAIFAALGLIYQATHGDKPLSMQMFMPGAQQSQTPPPPVTDKNSGAKGFTPPGE